MSITSLTFLVFAFAVFALYYLIPKRFQWVLLLVASVVFYTAGGIQSAGYVVITATSIYFAARAMQKLAEEQKQYIKANKATLTKEEKTAYKTQIKKKRKFWMLAALLLNIGLLCFFKYFHFVLEQINAILGLTGAAQINDTFKFIIPLGISFYTFQAVGYLLNVYWEKTTAEKNYLKFLLFVSFFPQMTQGPISEYDQLSEQLFTEHGFEYKNYAWGFQRMIWGFFKKMVIANQLAKYVSLVFDNYAEYAGISVLIGAFLYSVQIYADFSGYMDIMCGFCETLGIHLTENFERPYFSKSVAEYWRRWHMSLGAWFKNYIYFPIGMSTWNRKLAKTTRARFGKHFASTFPATIALLVVWTATGMWHGASWAYISWGLVNGLFIIFGMWMEPVYEAWRNKLHLRPDVWLWRAFQVIRTFVLVTFIKVLPEVGTLSDGLGLWKQIFTNHEIPHSLTELLPYVEFSWIIDKINVLLVVAGVVTMFVMSLMQRKKPVREYFNKLPTVIRWVVLAGVLICIASFGVRSTWDTGGFMYAQF